MAESPGAGSSVADSPGEKRRSGEGDRPAFQALAGPLASFHAAVFVAVPVLVAHATGALGGLLAGLDTAVGIGAYLLLWGLARATAGAWVAGFPGGGWTRAVGTHLLRAGGWGAVTGVGFLWVGLTAVLADRLVVVGVGGFTPAFVGLFLAVGYGIGAGVAALVGALAGVALGTVDYALFSLAVRIVGWAEPGDESPDGSDDGPPGEPGEDGSAA